MRRFNLLDLGICFVISLVIFTGYVFITQRELPEIRLGVEPRVQTVRQGGTGNGEFSPNALLTTGTSTTNRLLATSSPSFQAFFATSTTVVSTIAGGLTISGGTITFSGLTGCDTIDTNGSGVLACGSDATGAGGGVYPFTPQTFGGTEHSASSTRPFYFGMGLLTSSSTIGTLTAGAITATSTLTVTPLTSALILTDSNGLFGEYTGIDCTNQFVRDVSALGAGTCATIVAADVDLADLTATDGTLTFSGAYDGSTARTVGLNLGNANTWTALQTFGGLISNASSTISQNLQVDKLFASTTLQIPYAAQPTIVLAGLALDTTSGFLLSATSSVDVSVVYARPEKRLYSFVVASTTLNAGGFSSGNYMALPTEARPSLFLILRFYRFHLLSAFQEP